MKIQIISDPKIKEIERLGHLKLLKKIMYNNTCYEFNTLKSFYAACLREIEVGYKTWADDFTSIESTILQKHIPKSKTWSHSVKMSNFKGKKHSEAQVDSEDKFWFCSLYQRNKCAHKGNHIQVIKGKARFCQHVCGTCWQKDGKKLEHPECSSACPYTSF